MVRPFMWSQFDTYHLPKQSTPLHGTGIPNGNGLFQQDNVSCHSAHTVGEWFEEHDEELKVLAWPANSPDLNPIGRLCDVLEQQV